MLDLNNITLRISSSEYLPFVIKQVQEDGSVVFGGLCGRIIQAMAEAMNFQPKWHEVRDGQWGMLNSSGLWNGMIGEVHRGEAEIAASGITITGPREEVVDFIFPFWEESTGVLVREVDDQKLLSIFQPFSSWLWISILCSMGLVSCSLWLVSYFTLVNDPLASSFMRCVWYSTMSLLNQGQVIQPKATSVRCIAGLWLFLAVVIYATYSANLMAFLTVKQHKMPFDSLEDMVIQNKYKYGVYDTGVAHALFQTSELSLYQDIYRGIMSDPDNLLPNEDVGMHKVRTQKFAYIEDATLLKILSLDDCSIKLIEQKFYKAGFGFAIPENWPYKKDFDSVMMMLLEGGLVERWITEVFPPMECDTGKAYIDVKQISLNDLSGAIVIMGLGLSTASILLGAESIYKHLTTCHKSDIKC